MIGADGRPQVKSIRRILLEWIEIRKQTVTRRLQYHLTKIEKRLHILAGLLIAHLDIDTVIRIIREEDQPKPVLMQHFGIDDIQAEAIWSSSFVIWLKLEEMEIRREQEELEAKAAIIREQLANPESLKNLIIGELKEDAKSLVMIVVHQLLRVQMLYKSKEQDLMPAETVTVVLSEAGWVKTTKGGDVDANLNFRAGDQYLSHAVGKTNPACLLLR